MYRLFTLILLLLSVTACSGSKAKYQVVKAEGDVVKIVIEGVNDGKVHFFTFKTGGKNVDFFVRLDGSGRLHTHFDACYTCYRFKKGYRVEGTDIACIECGTRFRLADKVWGDVGGCKPIDIPHTEENGFVVVKASDLKHGEKLF